MLHGNQELMEQKKNGELISDLVTEDRKALESDVLVIGSFKLVFNLCSIETEITPFLVANALN